MSGSNVVFVEVSNSMVIYLSGRCYIFQKYHQIQEKAKVEQKRFHLSTYWTIVEDPSTVLVLVPSALGSLQFKKGYPWKVQSEYLVPKADQTYLQSIQYSCLENPVGGGAWWAAVHGVAKSQTTERLHFHF